MTVSDKTSTDMRLEQLQARRDAAPSPEQSLHNAGHNAGHNADELTQSDSLPETPADLPACCGTGCAVCVLDYPEYFSKVSNQKSESETLAMLEAIEEAQSQARQMIAEQEGDSQ